MTIYAKGTEVPAEKSRIEIEQLLARYGCTRFASGWDDSGAIIVFEAHARRLRFKLPLPDVDAKAFAADRNGRKRPREAVVRAHAQEIRSRWRALALVIKAKLESVESGIETFEEAFLANIVLPGGESMAEWAAPQIQAAYERGAKMPPLLGMG